MIKGISLITLLSASLLLGTAKGAAGEETKLLEADTNIIVSLDQDPFTCSKEEMNLAQNALVSDIKYLTGSKVEVLNKFNKSISAVELKVNSSVVSKIRSFDVVKGVDYNKLHTVNTNSDGAVSALKGLESIETDKENNSSVSMNKPTESNEGEGTLIAILDAGFMINANYVDDNEVAHTNEYHEIYTELENGTTLKIEDEAALKTLVDSDESFHGKYDASHSTYFNSKVPFYYDYAGDAASIADYNDDVATEPDYDVFIQSQPHGNHVASIAAGNAPHYKGIAPKAQLALMKVFVCADPTPEEAAEGAAPVCGAYDSDIMCALEDCITLGVDVLNMSLGSTLNDFDEDSAACIALQNCQKAGIFCAVAAGNDGRDTFDSSAYEFWTTEIVESGILSSYANLEESITVAASHTSKIYYEKALKIGQYTIDYFDQIQSTDTLSYTTERELTDLVDDFPSLEIPWERIGGFGEEEDYAGKNVQGKIVIVDRGETTFQSKVYIAEQHGAVAVGIIDNDASATEFNFRMDMNGYTPEVPVISILFRDRARIDSVTPGIAKLVIDKEETNAQADLMADFSSNGCTYDLRIKPEITAPGVSVLGAVTDSTTAYDYYDGTSMATPNAAGAIALIYGEHLNDSAWKSSVYNRIMSTANIGIDGTNDPHYESVRRQGAGLIDIEGAINTKAYITGSTKGVYTEKAKIELGNTEDIASGNINLKFKVVNTSNAPITYLATTTIERPELKELDGETYPELANTKLQATYDHVIDTKTKEITVAANTTTEVVLPTYTIPAEEKAILDQYFKDGCYIEGYVVLTALNEETINVPFLGFYGDYTSAIPVEPFKWEREEGKVYQSDITYGLVSKWAAKTTADFKSNAVLGYYKDLSKISMDDYLLCNKALNEFTDGTPKQVVEVGYNPYDGSRTQGKYANTIFANNEKTSNTLIMTQFVNRSVLTNTVTFTNKATQEVVLVDHMYDALNGAIENSQGEEIQWPLYKSQIDTNFWSYNIFCHRAYSLFPLYESSYNEDTEKYTVGAKWAEGEYEIKMDYTLMDGVTHYTRTYTLVIDNSTPLISSEEKIGNNLRIRYSGNTPMSWTQIQTKKYAVKTDDTGSYVDVPLADLNPEKPLWFNNNNYTSYTMYSVAHLNDSRFITLQSTEFTKNIYDFSTEVSTESGESTTQTFTLSLTQSKKAYSLKNDSFITLKPIGFDLATLKVEVKEKSGSFKQVEFTTDGGFITFSCGKIATFRLIGSYSEPVEPAPSKGGCGGSIIGASMCVFISAAIGASLLLKKRKED